MINDCALQRIYQEMGLAEDTPSNAGRRRKIRKAIEAAYPDIRASVEAEIDTEPEVGGSLPTLLGKWS